MAHDQEMLRRILACFAAVIALGTSAPPAEAASTGTALFVGSVQMMGGSWAASSSNCVGVGVGPGIGLQCIFTAMGTMSGSCTLWSGSAFGTLEFPGFTRIDFVGTATGVSMFGTDLKLAITGSATNPWTGDTGTFDAVIMGVAAPFAGPCQSYVNDGLATATLPL